MILTALLGILNRTKIQQMANQVNTVDDKADAAKIASSDAATHVAQLHTMINSRMTELLRATQSASFARGKEAERTGIVTPAPDVVLPIFSTPDPNPSHPPIEDLTYSV
jgi:hypothetical protein